MNNQSINPSDRVSEAFQTRFLNHLLADNPPPTTQWLDSTVVELTEINFAEIGSTETIEDDLYEAFGNQAFEVEALLDLADGSDVGLGSGSLTPAINPQPSEDDARSLGSISPQPDPMLELDALPLVQARFQTLLENHLKAEALNRMPLFPWESEVLEYEDDVSLSPASSPAWLAQTAALQACAKLPLDLLTQVFDRCQALAQEGLLQINAKGELQKKGLKLIQAVGDLFDLGDQALNTIAGEVLRREELAYRSSVAPTLPVVDYAAAGREGQLALAMMAASELLGSLILVLPRSGSQLERQWLTGAGMLTLAVRLDHTRLTLSAEVHLPCAGQLDLVGPESRATAERAIAGPAIVELLDPIPGRTYSLSVSFADDADLRPLTFAIIVPES